MPLSRRDAIHRLSMLVGGTLSAPALGAILSGCRAEPAAANWIPRALTVQQSELLGIVVDLIIPATDTPGARDVGVPAFIDKLLDDWVEPETRDRFLAGLADIETESVSAYGVAFRDANPTQQTALLERLDREAVEARRNRTGPLPFFATLKEWTLVGYYTSEVGATQELQWLPLPGRYDGDVPLSEVGRTWA